MSLGPQPLRVSGRRTGETRVWCSLGLRSHARTGSRFRSGGQRRQSLSAWRSRPRGSFRVGARELSGCRQGCRLGGNLRALSLSLSLTSTFLSCPPSPSSFHSKHNVKNMPGEDLERQAGRLGKPLRVARRPTELWELGGRGCQLRHRAGRWRARAVSQLQGGGGGPWSPSGTPSGQPAPTCLSLCPPASFPGLGGGGTPGPSMLLSGQCCRLPAPRPGTAT